ncbi:hypothetical protein LMG28688_01423 [Paraburkholderia caffeinitolerans]|uniref:Uncharacterized protein n=2 Tax=Paraburkholderia TaxID=1822464 RepID=A0A6J5FKX3_9BURK|nr:hypothetical protein GCM10011400_60860 [Paraburkholderia caffeinilytica]CAB3782078.1 hypothetical protein LMG28688_01423 [Paraburkholderia caffeinitolerans]CAB3802643.1 hypothetical protein LMG28690_05628 [Paraburkholderia caffeinilytica]
MPTAPGFTRYNVEVCNGNPTPGAQAAPGYVEMCTNEVEDDVAALGGPEFRGCDVGAEQAGHNRALAALGQRVGRLWLNKLLQMQVRGFA